MVDDTLDSRGWWREPGGVHLDRALAELGLDVSDLEEVHPDYKWLCVPVGEYPTLDRVYERAWRLRFADEGP